MSIYMASNTSKFLAKRVWDELLEENVCKREPFQRDRDRIIHSRSFRRMMHKTQIFNANKGDHYRNRLTHTLEVTQIARSIGKALELNDELVEAIALGHDLGHTPFGHIGERTLDSILMTGIPEDIKPIAENFKHNFQSLRVCEYLESRCDDYCGINLTLAVREGILKHTKTIDKDSNPYKYKGINLRDVNLSAPSFTLEGQVVAISDEIAQCTHDLEDGVRSKIINFNQLLNNSLVQQVIDKQKNRFNKDTVMPTYDTRNLIIKNLVGYLIKDVFTESKKRISKYCEHNHPNFSDKDNGFNKVCIAFSSENEILVKRLTDWIRDQIIYSEEISISDAKSEYILKQMFKAYYIHPRQLPDYVLGKYYRNRGLHYNRANMDTRLLQKDTEFIRTIADHIAGMTDQFASREYKRLYIPDYI